MNILRTTQSIIKLPRIFVRAAIHGTTRPVGIALQQGVAQRSFLTTAHWNSPTKETSKESTIGKEIATKKPTVKKSTKANASSTAKSKKTAKAKAVQKENKPSSKTQIRLQERARRAEERAARKSLVDYGPPHHVPSVYALFTSQFLKDGTWSEGTTTNERMKLAAQAWKRLSEEEKRPYQQLHDAAKAERALKYNEWMKTFDPVTFLLINRRRSKAGMRLIGRPNFVEPGPLSPFFRFVDEFRARYATEHGVDGKLTMEGNRSASRLAGEVWRALSEEDKNPYIDAFKADYAKVLASRQK